MKLSTTVSNLIDKDVICLSTATNIGKISGVLFDARMRVAKMLIITSNNANDAEKKYISLQHLLEVKFDAVVIKNEACAKYYWNALPPPLLCPIGAVCYSHTGKNLGTLTDVIIKENFSTNIIVEKHNFLFNKLLSVSNNLLCINTGDAAIKIARPKKSISVSNQNVKQKVNLHSYNFLLNKKCTKTIYDGQNNILVKAEAIIQQKDILLCKQYGRLVHLALYSATT